MAKKFTKIMKNCSNSAFFFCGNIVTAALMGEESLAAEPEIKGGQIYDERSN